METIRRDVPVVQSRQCLAEAMGLLQDGTPVIGVTDTSGQLVGLVTLETVGEMMMVHGARPPGSRAGSARGGWRRTVPPVG